MAGEPERSPEGSLARRSLTELERISPNIPVFIWTATPHGQMEAQSQQFLAYLGLDRLDLPGGEWQRYVHPDDLDRVLAVWQRALESESPYVCEYRILHRSREFRWFRFDARPVLDPDGRVDSWIGTAVERHAEHLAELELERAAAMLGTASRLGRLGGWSFDLRTGELEWSEAVRALHEVPEGFVPEVDTAIEFYLPDDRPIIEAAVADCIERGQPYDLELRIRTATGRIRWCRTLGEAERDDDGVPVRLWGAFQDVTEHKLAEIALRESEERFRTLSRATSDVVADWDLVRGTVWYSEGTRDLLGPDVEPDHDPGDGVVPTEEPFERWWGSIHPDDVERVRAELAEALRSVSPEWDSSFRLVRRDHSVVELELTASTVLGADGTAERLVASFVDVTAARDLERRLARSQQLESIGQLTGGIAHDFNNLLSVVIGGTDLLAAEFEADAPAAEVIDRIRAAAERGAELTQRLLAFARRQPLDPSPVEVPTLLGSIERLVRPLIGENIMLSVEIDATSLAPVLIDPGQLENALLNLCLNARDAMPDGGSLVLRARPAELDGKVAGSGPRAAVSIEVVDTGTGIPSEVLDRVLDPFFTTKPPGRGTGLGLSMVYGFVQQSAGTLAIESEPGRGTTVRLVLPAAIGTTAGAAIEPARPITTSRPNPSALRVLVVEDDPLVRSLVVTQLEALGHEVLEAADGPSALELLQRPAEHEPIDLLFTDLVMPGGLDGRAVAEQAVGLRPGLPVLFTTGYAGDTSLTVMPDGTPMEVLPKPYRLGELRERLDDIVRRQPPVGPS